MKHELLDRFREIFEIQRKDLVFSQNVIDAGLRLEKDDMLDEVDMTSCELETSMRTRLRNRETLFMKKIDEALRRIEDGSFGCCVECGDDIELKRLEARPTATLCVHCKEEQERLEHTHIDGHRPKSLGKRLRMA